MKTAMSPSEGLRQIQLFLDGHHAEDKIQDHLHSCTQVLSDPTTPRGVKSRFLLQAMQHLDASVREHARGEADRTFTREKDPLMLNDLLSFAMENYQDHDHARGVLIKLLQAELKASRFTWRTETVRFVLNLRRVFEIAYDEDFARDCVSCLFFLMEDRERDLSGALYGLSFQRLHGALAIGEAPDTTISAIKYELGRLPLEKVAPAFIEVVYQGLPKETNEKRVADSLQLLTRWFKFFPLGAHPNPKDLFARIQLYYRERHGELQPLDLRILEGNNLMVDLIADLLEEWPESALIGRRAIQCLCLLSSARRLIADRHREDRPVFLRRWIDPNRSHYFEMALTYYRHFIYGLSANLDQKDQDDADDKDGSNYRHRLVGINRWAKLDQDLEVLKQLTALMGDANVTHKQRMAVVDCLADIHPPDLEQRFLNFAREHPIEDSLVPYLIQWCSKSPSWDFWLFCEHYFKHFTTQTQHPLLMDLIQAAGSTGNSAMGPYLVPLAFDHPDSAVADKARNALIQAGYEVFLQREKITRILRRLKPQRDQSLDRLQAMYTERRVQHKNMSAFDRDTHDIRRDMEADGLDLRQHATHYRDFSTNKRIVLTELDQQLDELNKKIDHLTHRKIELERAKDELIARRDRLIEVLQEVQAEARRVFSGIETLQRKIQSSHSSLNQLERKREKLIQEMEAEKRNFESVRRDEDRANQQRVSQHKQLQNDRTRNQEDIRSYENRAQQIQRTIRDRESDHHDLKRRISVLESQIRAEPPDSSRRTSLQSQRSSHISQANSMASKIDSYRSEIAKVQRDANRLAQRNAEIQSKCVSLNHEVAVSQERVSRKEQTLASVVHKVGENADQINREHAVLHGYITEQATLQRRREKIEQERHQLEGQIRVLEREEQRLEQELLPVIRDLEDAKREYQRINRLRECEEREIDAFRVQADETRKVMRQRIDNHERTYDALHEQICRLEQAVSHLQSEHTREKSHFDQLITEIKDQMAELESLDSICEEAIKEKNQSAYTKTLLARLERAQHQFHRLEYGRAVDLAARALAAEKEG